MPSSDSEDFESADEGQTHTERKERKKRLSSSNYSENALESDSGPKETSTLTGKVEKPKVKKLKLVENNCVRSNHNLVNLSALTWFKF